MPFPDSAFLLSWVSLSKEKMSLEAVFCPFSPLTNLCSFSFKLAQPVLPGGAAGPPASSAGDSTDLHSYRHVRSGRGICFNISATLVMTGAASAKCKKISKSVTLHPLGKDFAHKSVAFRRNRALVRDKAAAAAAPQSPGWVETGRGEGKAGKRAESEVSADSPAKEKKLDTNAAQFPPTVGTGLSSRHTPAPSGDNRTTRDPRAASKGLSSFHRGQ